MSPSYESILAALKPGGSTTGEIAQALSCSPSKASQRLSMLRQRGDVEMLIVSAGKLVWRRRVSQ